MAAARVVPAVDVVEHSEASRRLGGEALTLQELALVGREEAVAQRIVVAVADGAHRGLVARVATPEPEGDRSVLAPWKWSKWSESPLGRSRRAMATKFGLFGTNQHPPTSRWPSAGDSIEQVRLGRDIGFVACSSASTLSPPAHGGGGALGRRDGIDAHRRNHPPCRLSSIRSSRGRCLARHRHRGAVHLWNRVRLPQGFGLSPGARVARALAHLDVITSLGGEPVDYESPSCTLRGAALVRPVQMPPRISPPEQPRRQRYRHAERR
jgi:hypothetical protein